MAVYTVPSTRPYLGCGEVTFCVMFLPSKVHTIYICEVPGFCLVFLRSSSILKWTIIGSFVYAIRNHLSS